MKKPLTKITPTRLKSIWRVDPRKTNPGQEKSIWLESNKKYQS